MEEKNISIRANKNGPYTVEGIWPVHGRIAYPGVIIDGQIGPLVASRIPQKVLEKSLAILFILVAVLMIANVIIK